MVLALIVPAFCAGAARAAARVAGAPAGPAAGTAPVPAAFEGTGLWVREVAPGESAAQLAADAAAAGARALYVKAGDGSTEEPQFTQALAGELRQAGLTVCAWTFMYGSSPVAEADVAAAAARAGAQCLIIDAEGASAPRNLYGAAQLFVRTLRAALPSSFPIALATQAEVGAHPTFPYSVFLAPGAFNAVMPLIYWLDFGQSVEAAFAQTIAGQALYGRPILPVGQLYGAPTDAELEEFRALALSYGLRGWSFFDLDAALPQQLSALAAAAPLLPRRPLRPAALHPGADGDEIVQAQELLNAAGAHLPVGGYYGAQTARAVAVFQARRHLRATGLLGPATWAALLRLEPREPSWAAAPPLSAG